MKLHLTSAGADLLKVVFMLVTAFGFVLLLIVLYGFHSKTKTQSTDAQVVCPKFYVAPAPQQKRQPLI